MGDLFLLLKTYARVQRWTDQYSSLSLPLFLRDDALIFYSTLDEVVKLDYETLKDYFFQRYESKRRPFALSPQKVGEGVQQYIEIFQKTMDMLNLPKVAAISFFSGNLPEF